MTRDEIITHARARAVRSEHCTTWACVVLGVAPGTPRWRAIQVADHRHPWSAAQYHAGLPRWWPGQPGPDAPTPGSVCLVQGWRHLSAAGDIVPGRSRGHTWLWLTHPSRYWEGYMLHSSAEDGARMADLPIAEWDGVPVWSRLDWARWPAGGMAWVEVA